MRSRIIITGASGAMGAAATRAMAERGYDIIMACRNPGKAETVRAGILRDFPQADISIGQLDLSSLDSVRSFMENLDDRPLHALFNNAGVISRGYSLTGDGLEHTFAVNYFGPVLLTRLLMDRMTEDAHVVNMVSLTTRFVRIDCDSLRPREREFSQLGTYARSKLALLRFSQELSRRRPQLHVNLADPGIVNSNMISMGRWFDPLADVLFRPFCKSPEKGATPAVNALLSDDRDKYFVGNRCKAIPDTFNDPDLDLRLWQETSRVLSLDEG